MKKNQIEALEMKSSLRWVKKKKPAESIWSRLNQEEHKISETENKVDMIEKLDENVEKRMKNYKRNMQKLWLH
jgi:hypothetical protein